MNFTIKNSFIKDNVSDFKFVQQNENAFIKDNQPLVIFATPGMLHGKMSLSIIKGLAPDSKNCVLILGYCSISTVGNRILSGDKYIEINKTIIEVKCEVYYMSFSAHADAKRLLQLIDNVKPKNVILIHGDKKIMKTFQSTWREKWDILITMPSNYDKTRFNADPRYIQYDIGYSLIEILRVLFQVNKDVIGRGNRAIGVKGIRLRENRLNIDKVNIFKGYNGKGIKMRNRAVFGIKQLNGMKVFRMFIENYSPFVKKHYDRLIKESILKIEYKEDNGNSNSNNKVIFN